jgi:PAS domain S-box-containing protein
MPLALVKRDVIHPPAFDAAQRLETRAVQQHAAVANLGKAALSGAGMDVLFDITSSFVTDLLAVDLCSILEVRGDAFRATAGSRWVKALGILDARSASQAAHVVATGAPVVTDDLPSETRFHPSPALLREGILSSVTVPIHIGESEIWGTLGAHTRTSLEFTTSDVDFLRAMAGVLGHAVLRRRADDELQTRAKRQSAMSELMRLAFRSVDDETLTRTRATIIDCLGVADVAFLNGGDDPVATACIPVAGYGVLALYGAPDRRFTGEELEFVHAVANILAEAIDRDRAARELAASEQRYREVIEGASEVIFTLSMDGRFKSINAAFESVTGWPAAEWIGKPYLELIHPEERLHSREVFRAVIERQEAARDTLTIIGRESMAEIELTSFPKTENGRTTAIYGFARDVTEARRVERERQQLTRSLQLLLESTVDAILTFDLNGNCTMSNGAATKMFGPIADRIVLANIGATLLEVGRSGNVRSDHVAVTLGDGSRVHVEYSAAPVVDDGVRVGVVVTLTDISERLRLENKLAQADRVTSLGRLAATVAHEFNNILMGISSFGEMIRRGKNVPTAVEQIAQSVRRGKRITGDILRYTQHAEPVRAAFDVAPWLDGVIEEARSLMPSHCEVKVAGERQLRIDGDASQLQQVFTNLILNARDAMPAGGTLSITVAREQNNAHFIVSDTGCGVAPETLRHIFEPLFTTKKNGTGLGLSVVHQVVTRHGGEVSVESTPGLGTTFHILLPLASSAAGHASAAGSALPFTPPGASRMLLVEDDEVVGEGLRLVLSLDNVDVMIVRTGAEAIHAAHTNEFDVMILDVGLPDMDGLHVYNAVAAMCPELPVIFSTGHADRSNVDALLTRPDVAFLLKPYDPATLLSTMREVMNRAA